MGYCWENQRYTFQKGNNDTLWSPKRATDTNHFIPEAPILNAKPLCPFCWGNLKNRSIEIYDSVFAIYDENPVAEGHLLILTKRHIENYFGMTVKERMDCDDMIQILSKKIFNDDRAVTGFNIGINCGESAGQTIFHAHFHLIPRREGDTPNPRSGARAVIPDKMRHQLP